MKVKYSPAMKVTNMEHLPKGIGAKYLLALIAHDGTYIAHSWKRKAPAVIPAGYVLIELQ